MAEGPVNNKSVIQLLKDQTGYKVAQHLQNLPSSPSCSLDSLARNLRKLKEKYDRLRRNGARNGGDAIIEDFLKQPFLFPVSNPGNHRPRSVRNKVFDYTFYFL